ncbi:MAG TPA: hypothetical protein VM577_21330 [Anaerovoracaceae bacterium]|nr:hypothetical protein [Anaerovoracaceae bacterium]
MKKLNPYWLFFKVLAAITVLGIGYALYNSGAGRIVVLAVLIYASLIGMAIGVVQMVMAGMAWDRNNK